MSLQVSTLNDNISYIYVQRIDLYQELLQQEIHLKQEYCFFIPVVIGIVLIVYLIILFALCAWRPEDPCVIILVQ